MMDLESISEQTREQVARVGSADLVIGLADCPDVDALRAALATIEQALLTVEKPPRALILYPDTVGDLANGNGNTLSLGAQQAALRQDDAAATGSGAGEVLASAADTPMAVPEQVGSQLVAVPLPYWPSERLPDGAPVDTHAMLTLAMLGHKVGARVSCLWSSPAAALSSEAVLAFGEAIGGEGYDLAMPGYVAQKFGGLLNSGILAPFARTLYGQRVAHPMAQDLALSARLCEQLLRPDPRTGAPQPPQWIAAYAVCRGLRLCQVELGLPAPQPRLASDDLSSVLALVLGSLFQDAERNASFWHRTRATQPARRFGQPVAPPPEQNGVDVHAMIEGFSLACKNLSEIWAPVLPPATLLELKKLGRAAEGEFRLADATWARVVFDFLLAQRQRLMTRDHLLRAFTPIYLAWVASYVMQVEKASSAQAAARLEQLAKAFESQRPYLLSRWRWPDRFNP